jgi:hypothetical protein
MDKRQKPFERLIARRRFCNIIVGLVAGFSLDKVPFTGKRSLEVTVLDPAYLVVSGWVLRRDDFAAANLPHVV